MNSNNNHIRAFIGISFPKEVILSLKHFQRQLRTYGIRASWPRPENMHLTLSFFEKIHINRIESIKECMTMATAKTPAHIISFSGIGAFPSIKRPRVIWAGTIGQTDILKKFVNRLSIHLLENLEIKKEKKKFIPHVTVARIKQPIQKKVMELFQKFKTFGTADFLISEIHFFQSELKPSGAVHKKIFSIPLKK